MSHWGGQRRLCCRGLRRRGWWGGGCGLGPARGGLGIRAALRVGREGWEPGGCRWGSGEGYAGSGHGGGVSLGFG